VPPSGVSRLALLVLALVVALSASGAHPAQARETGGVRVLPQGALRAGGAGAVIALWVACSHRPVNLTAMLEVHVRQALPDGGEAVAYGYSPGFDCTPPGQQRLVPVLPVLASVDPAPPPLVVGPIRVQARFEYCGGEWECPVSEAVGVQVLSDRDDLDRAGLRWGAKRYRVGPEAPLEHQGLLIRPRFTSHCDMNDQFFGAYEVFLQQRVGSGHVVASRRQLVHLRGNYCASGPAHPPLALVADEHVFRPGAAFLVAEVHNCLRTGACGGRVIWSEVELIDASATARHLNERVSAGVIATGRGTGLGRAS